MSNPSPAEPLPSRTRQFDTQKAERMLKAAMNEIGDKRFVPYKFEDVDARTFVERYCKVVYASGFKVAVVEKHFKALAAAWCNFNLDAISAMDSVNLSQVPIKHARKADGFLKGCKKIAAEGFDNYKARLLIEGMDMLTELPWISSKTKRHLAMTIGLEDVAKCDRWLVRCAETCSADFDEFVDYLSNAFSISKQQVDSYLFLYCQKHQKIPPD